MISLTLPRKPQVASHATQLVGTVAVGPVDAPGERRRRWLDSALLLTIATRGAQIAIALAASVITARFLGPAGRGEYFVVVTLARTLAQFGNLGQQSSNTYLVARDRTLLAGLVANSFWVSLLAGGGSACLLLIGMHAGPFIWGPSDAVLWFAALLAPVSLFYALGTNLLVGIRQFALFNAFELTSGMVVLTALLIAGVAGAGPSGFLATSVTAWAIVAAALLWVLRVHSPGAFRFQPGVFRSGLRYSAKAYLATLAGFLLLRSNVFILNAMKGAEQVGYYSVATQFADVLGILPQSVALILFPNLVGDRIGRFDRTIRSMLTTGALLAVGCIAAAWLVDPIIRIALGPKFLAAGPVLRLLLPGVFFAGITGVVSQYLSAVGFPRAQVAVWFWGFGVAAALSWLLIPRWGGGGAAIALSITHLFVFVLILRLAWVRHRQGADRH